MRDTILDAFEHLVGSGLTPSTRLQAGLPMAQGGCGLNIPTMQAGPARMAALVTYYGRGAALIDIPAGATAIKATWLRVPVHDLKRQLGPAFDPLPRWEADISLISQGTQEHQRQKRWASACATSLVSQLLDKVEPRDQARLLEQGNSLGSSFMAVPPLAATCTIIPSDLYRLGLRWWLGIPLIGEPGDAPSKCSGCTAELDPFGDHLLCCRRLNFTRRHQGVQEGLVELLAKAGQPTLREQKLPNCPDGQLRPADLLLRAWTGGKDCAADMTVCHGWQATERNAPAGREKWRTFLVRKERAKMDKYAAHCQREGWAFTPLAFGTWGGQGPEAAKFLARVLKRAASWGDKEDEQLRVHEMRTTFGWSLMSHILTLLQGKNYAVPPAPIPLLPNA